ncbi:hypothetical protein ACFLTH_14850 [Bacteroidota bacterium]
MIYEIKSGGVNIVVLEQPNIKLGMAKNSLDQHILTHPDMAKTPDEYLTKAAEVLTNGRNYKKGKLYRGIFARAYDSAEIGAKMLLTLHNRFNN